MSNEAGHYLKTISDRGTAGNQAATFIIAASDSLHPERADYVCDGTDDQVQINAAIDALPVGGGNVALMEGTWYISSEVLFQNKSNITLVGIGFSTILTGVGNNNIIKVGHRTNAALSSTRIIIKGLQIDGSNQDILTTTPETTDSQLGIEFCSPAGETKENIVRNCFIYNTGGDGIYGYFSGSCLITENIVKDVRGYWGGIHLHGGADTWSIQNNYLKNCARHGIRHGQIIGNVLVSCGATGATAPEKFASIQGYPGPVMGNVISSAPSYGIQPHQSGSEKRQNISNNRISNSGSIAIYADEEQLIISENIISGGWRGISIDSSNLAHNSIITNNQITGMSDTAAIALQGSNNVIVVGNHIDPGDNITHSGANLIIRNNDNHKTENSGTATIVSGQTAIAVDHGLAATPAAGDIVVTPIKAWGNMAQFYIDTYTSTQFTIHADADPGQDVDFAWKAIVL